jgi:hypothetical protein
MTTLEQIPVECGLCRTPSQQHTIGSTSRFGSPDLDLRPPELERSTLAWWSARCPECGFVSGSDLALPDGATEDAVRAAVESDAYRIASADPELPQIARDALCRAVVADTIGDRPAAVRFVMWAAWACDDRDASPAAARLRLEAVERIRRLHADGERVFEEDAELADRIVICDLLRRAGRHRDGLEEASRAFGVDAPDDLVRILHFQAELAWRGDESAHSLAEANDAQLGRDPTSRRVPCNAVDAEAATPITAIEIGRDDVRVELRRGERASAWYLIASGDAWQISAWEAAVAVAAPHSRTLWDVLDATAAELEWWAFGLGWRAAVNVDYPREEAALQALYEEWNLAWTRQAQIEHNATREVLDPLQVSGRLAEAAARGYGDASFVVRGRPDDERAYAGVIADALRHVVQQRPRGTIAVFEREGGYIQLIASRGCPTVYLEAVDLDHQGSGTLTDAQRAQLAAFGWHDPKLEAVPYEDAYYGRYWGGGNLVQEIDRTLLDVIAGTVKLTLTSVYGLEPGDDLRVSIFDHLGG